MSAAPAEAVPAASSARTAGHVWYVVFLLTVVYIAGDTFNGVRVRDLPALTAADAWHARKGYIASERAVEAYIYNYETGYSGHVSVNAREVARDAEQASGPVS